jgi:hypothetical protein
MRIMHRKRPRASVEDRYFDLDEAAQRRFWNRAAAHMWAGRERERHCVRGTVHHEHWYRSQSTPSNIIYYCDGSPR